MPELKPVTDTLTQLAQAVPDGVKTLDDRLRKFLWGTSGSLGTSASLGPSFTLPILSDKIVITQIRISKTGNVTFTANDAAYATWNLCTFAPDGTVTDLAASYNGKTLAGGGIGNFAANEHRVVWSGSIVIDPVLPLALGTRVATTGGGAAGTFNAAVSGYYL